MGTPELKPNWWRGLPPASIKLECLGEKHTVTWERGKLTTPNHPERELEEGLVALGGSMSLVPCMRQVAAWEAWLSNPNWLWSIDAPPGRIRVPSPNPFIMGLELDLAFRRRAAVALVEIILATRGRPRPGFRSLLHNHSCRIARRLIHESHSEAVGRPTLQPVVKPIRRGLPGPVTTGWSPPPRSRFQIEIPERWIAEVWARELELVDRAVTVRLVELDGSGRSARAEVLKWRMRSGKVEPELVEVEVRRRRGQWQPVG